MNETAVLTLVLAGLAGGVIGLFFFGGLWWTVRKGVSAQQPALWFFGSMVLRMCVALAGFYIVSNRHLDRLMFCLLGFFLARIIVMRLTRVAEKTAYPAEKVSHAP
ncbi:MAG: ATP synthase subunit I [Desulfuromonadaceae bacterium]|nr:ATP synthase subunit I [Desulfuromonadaceae bacterium]MDD2848295.1 ATP synthase subunit I [Desulfuromonadaceae bacterium]MDD4129309.1 ATP synthase subunit I [Desulfuromonadaceae bacterium]